MSAATPHEGFSVEHVGNEQQPIVIVDDFSSEFESLLQQAAGAKYISAESYYPGVRSPAPANYLQERQDVLQRILRNVFGFSVSVDLIECNFSIVTTPPTKLTLFQRLPHFDSADENRLALLHYCGDASKGGTSFYRHKSTGYETITEPRLKTYQRALNQEIEDTGEPSLQYFSGSSEHYERIGQIDSKSNRMIIYRGVMLHSGDIPLEVVRPSSVESARLTINTFVNGR